jgi:hypothetical protein
MSNIGSRRDFLASGACLLTFTVAAHVLSLTPAQARAARIPLHILDPVEAGTLEALGETLLPGSAASGIAHYVDHQLAGDPTDSMLMIKYLRVPPPFRDFYRTGLRAIDTLAHTVHGKSFAGLMADQATQLVTQLSAGQAQKWEGPPAALFYFVLRSDAVDVTYGTQSGFELLGVPYMAHIAPPTRWGE